MGDEDRRAAERREDDFIRQSERTVDNLKRLTAYVFAISFSLAGVGVVHRLIPVFTIATTPVPPLLHWLVNGEMLMAFAVTAGLFFYQGDKFLDNHFARRPVAEPRRYRIALRYLVLVLTMAPFFLMANSLTPEVTGPVGFLWFFGSYVLLFVIGLLLVTVPLIDWRLGAGRESRRDPAARDEHVLRTFWFVMNSAFLLLAVGCFALDHWALGDPCPARISDGRTPVFLVAFGVVAFLRDAVDYSYAFRFHFPVRDPSSFDRWPITALLRASSLTGWYVAGIAMIAALCALLVELRAFDLHRWITACAP